MEYFKCIHPKAPAMVSTANAVGKHGAFECVLAVAEAINLGEYHLDSETVASWAGVKRDRAETLLPYAQKILTECLRHYRKSRKNSENPDKNSGNDLEISENPSVISENLLDFDPSNPRGSREPLEKDIEKEEEKDLNLKETPTDLEGVGVENFEVDHEPAVDPVVVDACSLSGMKYAERSGNANLDSFDWVRNYLAGFQQSLHAARPDLKPQDILTCWQSACDTAAVKGAVSPDYYKTVFERKINECRRPATPRLVEYKPKKPRHEEILEAPFVEFQGCYFRTDEFEYIPPVNELGQSVFRHKETLQEYLALWLKPVQALPPEVAAVAHG